MSGVYLHIPFCKKACHYCNFHFSTSLSSKSSLLNAMYQELEERKSELISAQITSIYFGGGTPSLLNMAELNHFFDILSKNFKWVDDIEITLEANPDDLDFDYVADLKRFTPINRISVGVQSFVEAELQYMNRSHTAFQSEQAIENLFRAGFQNISADLIYGCPQSSNDSWFQQIEKIHSLGVEHLSCYALTVEPQTALFDFIAKNKCAVPIEDQALDQFLILQEACNQFGYDAYEISNYCKNEKYAKHNTSYWKAVPYLGIGPSAHSFDGKSRSWNIANNALYIQRVKQGLPYSDQEILTEKDLLNEWIMTGLRTKWGIQESTLLQKWNSLHAAEMEDIYRMQLQKGYLIIDENRNVIIPMRHKFISDQIISDLFLV
jgi:oxygen-independent coproporphyrinogen-3 oxidase